MENNIVNQLPETNFNDGMSDSSTFSTKSSPVRDFNVCTTDYLRTESTSLSKTINSSITNESFNLCCDFTASAVNQFSPNVNSYSPVVSTKPSTSYNESLLGKSDVNYSCTSTNLSNRSVPAAHSNSELLPNVPVEPATSKTDYFPSAVNSVVVSETGKKYPKKYSFYSDFSSFLNQETSFNKDCRSSNSESSKLCDLSCSTTASRDIQQPLMQMNQQISINIESNNRSVPVETSANSHSPTDMPIPISPTINTLQARKGRLKQFIHIVLRHMLPILSLEEFRLFSIMLKLYNNQIYRINLNICFLIFRKNKSVSYYAAICYFINKELRAKTLCLKDEN